MIAGYFFDLRIYFCIYIVYVYNRIGENQLSPKKFNPPFAGNAIYSCVLDDMTVLNTCSTCTCLL